MPDADCRTRRAVVFGLLGCLPIGRLAHAAPLVAGPSVRAPAMQVPTPRAAALAELSGALSHQSDLAAALQLLDADAEQLRGQLASSPGVNADKLSDKLAGIEVDLRELDAQTGKLEQLGLKISEMQSGALPGVTADAGDAAVCASVNRQLFAAGYLDSVQMTALARGQFVWTTNEVYAALARGRAAADQFIAPIAARLAANRELLVRPGPLPPAPAGRTP